MSTLFQHSNETLLLIIAEMLGKDVTLTLVGNVKYTGVLSACSQDLALGLRYAYKVTDANRHNLLPVQSQVHDKMIFPFKEIVDVTVYLNESKAGTKAMSFATDRDYHGVRNGASSGSSAPKNHNDDRLEEWTGEDDEGLGSIEDHDNIAHDLPDQRNRCGPGWSVEEMFAANKEKVVSTFKDDLTQYTTVAVEGTEEDRARADRLAREIEQNQSSKFYARLENDDIERDLDKETGEDDFETVGNRRKGFQNKSNNNQRQSSNSSSNLNTSTNRRAEALKGGNDNNRRNSGGQGGNSNNQQQQQRYSGNNSRRNDESFADKSSSQQQKSQNYPQKQMLDSRQNQSINKPSEEERRAGKNSIITSLKNFGNEFELKGGEQQNTVPQAAGAWNSGPPKSLLANKNEGGASTSENQEKRDPIENSASTSQNNAAPTESTNSNNYTKNNNTKLNDSAEQGSENESNTMTPSTADVSDASSTTGGVSKSASSFKFNVNAPEFVPTGAAKSTTPQPPGTPTGSVSGYAYGGPPQFGGPAGGPQEYAQGPGPQQMMQGQPMMVWQGGNGAPPQGGPQGPQQYGPQYQYVQLQAQPAQRAQGQGQIYAPQQNPGRNPAQNPQQRMYWQQQVIMPQPIGYFNPQAAAQATPPQGFAQGYPQGAGNPGGYAGNPGGRGANYQQQQMYMMQQNPGAQRGYPQQQEQAAYQSGPQSHPNSQPTTPGPQQQANNGQGQQGQQGNQQQPQPVPSPGQSVTGSNLRHGGAESGSQGSLAGSGSQTRSGSPQSNNNAPPIPPQHQMPPPPQIPPQQFAAAAAMHVPPPHPAQIHPGHPHPMQHHPGAPQPYYHHHPQQPIYYQQVYPQQPHGIPMQQGPHGVGPHHPGQMMVDQQHLMEQHQQSMHPQQQPFVVDQYNMYQNGPTYYQPPHGQAMSRQNSMPHQQFANNARNNNENGGSGGSQAGSQSGHSGGPQN